MMMEMFDAMVPAETMSFVTSGGELGMPGKEHGPSLEAALARAGLAGWGAKPNSGALLDRFDAASLDLGIGRLDGSLRWDTDDIEPGALRELDDDELELVAGGNVTVVGPDYWDRHPYDSGDNDHNPDGSGGGGGGSGDGSSEPDASPDLSHDETCGTADGAAV